MDLFEASEAGLPLLVEVDTDNHRVAAHIFSHPEGIVFADIGWCDPLRSFHAFHIVPGQVEGVGPWTVGAATIRQIDRTDPQHPEWLDWKQAELRQGDGCGRNQALETARQEFDF